MIKIKNSISDYKMILYSFIILLGSLQFPYVTFSGNTPPKFTISGKVKPFPHVKKMFFELTEKQEDKGTLYVILNKGRVAEISDILSGKFKFELEWIHSRDEITLRAIYPEGLVAYEDVVIHPNKIFHERTRSFVIEKVILLIRIEDRFKAEKELVKSFIESGDCLGALGKIQVIEDNFLPDGPEFFYILNKLKADALYSGVEKNCSFQESDLEAIYTIEENESFKPLDSRWKFNIYAQYARALKRINDPSRFLASGRTIFDIQNYCFKEAIKLKSKEELRSDTGWILTSEMISDLYENKKFDEAMDEIYKFFEVSEFPINGLSSGQKKCVVRLLNTYTISLIRFSHKLNYLEDDYIKAMAKDDILSNYWYKFGILLEKWHYLYPKNSNSVAGKKLYICSLLSKKITKERNSNEHP